MIVRFMQSAVGRILRLVIGFLLVVYSVYLPLALSVTLLLLGMFIAVMGLAGVCPLAALLGGKPALAGNTRESHV